MSRILDLNDGPEPILSQEKPTTIWTNEIISFLPTGIIILIETIT